MEIIRQKQVLKNMGNYNDSKFNDYLNNLNILIVGCGGVGSVIGELLARGGFKNINIIDMDVVDKTNLQRQLFVQEDIGKFKADCLKEKLYSINPNINVENYCENFNKSNYKNITKNTNLIIDATDNVETRKLINKISKEKNIPWVYNGALKAECMSCLFTKYELFDKVFRNFKTQDGCEVGVLASTTFTGGSLCYNLILQYLIEEKSNILVKIELLNYNINKIDLN